MEASLRVVPPRSGIVAVLGLLTAMLPTAVRAQGSDDAAIAAQTSPLIEQRFKLPLRLPGPTGAARDFALDTLLVRPPGAGLFPLAVITHGTSRDLGLRRKVRTDWFLPEARSFARRGWAAAVVVRRGFGESSGAFEEGYGTCDDPNFVHAGQEAAADLAGAVQYLGRQPSIDGARVLGIGQSTGGMAWLAAAARHVPGLVAVISFAGGNGSSTPGHNCSEPRLMSAFAQFGASKVPSLWIYADNDLYFGPDLAQRLLATYRESGGAAVLHIVPPQGADGHDLFLDPAGTQVWSPLVDQFLRAQGLPTWTVDQALIDALEGVHKEHFLRYLTAASEKAFAISGDGSWDWWVGSRTSTQDAVSAALDRCQDGGKRRCRAYAVNFSKPAAPSVP